MRVPFSYLDRQFEDLAPYLEDVADLVRSGKFTLGEAVQRFEREFALFCRLPHAVGVGTGTDSLALSLKLAGIQPGDEVITTTNTFIATVGAIVQAGGKPVFVDSEEGFVIDAGKIEAAVTAQTRAIVPVHYTGNVADMPAIAEIARRHGLTIVEDACQAIGAELGGQPVGSWGISAGFSLHPLKNVNVWGDGGVVATASSQFAEQMRLYRNHGLADRDRVEMWGVNSRLDALQAVVGLRLLKEAKEITDARIANAARYDEALSNLAPDVRVPIRRKGVKHVFHLYVIRAERRDQLLEHLRLQGIDARVHYPVPVHLQEPGRALGYGPGDFPQSEADCREIVTLPVHQHLTDEEIAYTIKQVYGFYR